MEANLVIATDPDVDRMGFVERNAMVKHITLVVVKLAHYSLNICSNTRMCRIIRLLFNLLCGELGKRLAQQHGVTVKEVLIGFKHIAKAIRELDDTESFLFAYEESYGYLADDFVRDKTPFKSFH